MPAESCLHRVGHLARLQREGRVGELGGQILLGDVAEIDRLFVLLRSTGRNRGKVLAGVEQRLGRLRRGLVGQDDLLKVAPFRPGELVDPLLVFLLEFVFGNLDPGRDVALLQA